ncbi:MAG: hypothetical protein QM765_22465 [Myxococcales bacterium]
MVPRQVDQVDDHRDDVGAVRRVLGRLHAVAVDVGQAAVVDADEVGDEVPGLEPEGDGRVLPELLAHRDPEDGVATGRHPPLAVDAEGDHRRGHLLLAVRDAPAEGDAAVEVAGTVLLLLALDLRARRQVEAWSAGGGEEHQPEGSNAMGHRHEVSTSRQRVFEQ